MSRILNSLAESDLDRLRIRQGETASVRARFAEPRDFEAIVSKNNVEIFRTSKLIEDLKPGDYEVRLVGVEKTTIPFRVIEPTSMEKTVIHANPHLLAEMASSRANRSFQTCSTF